MQLKYLSALKTRYASYGLSKEALDRVASQRVKTIANEDEIDGDVASFDTALLIMKEMQGSADSLRASKAQVQKELDDLKSAGTKVQEPEENELAKELAQMREMMTSMQSEIAESRKKARHEALLGGVHEKMKAMGCTNDFIRNTTLKGIEITEADTAESLAERYKAEYDANCKQAYGEGYVPPKGGAAGGDEIDFSSMVAGLQASGDLPK